MKTHIDWFKAIVLLAVLIFLTDMNLAWYKHPMNNIPVLKYSIIALSTLLFVMIVLNFIGKKKQKNNRMLSTVKDNIRNRFHFSINGNGINEGAVQKLKLVSSNDSDYFFHIMESNNAGLSDAQVTDKLKTVGLNEVQHEKAPSWFRQLMQAFVNPFIGILVVIAIISFIMDVWMAKPGRRSIQNGDHGGCDGNGEFPAAFRTGIQEQPGSRTIEEHGKNHGHRDQAAGRQNRSGYQKPGAW